MLYSRRELRLLFVVAAVFLVGLGVREWRAGYPDLALRLERFDRDATTTPLLSEPQSQTVVASSSAPPLAQTPPRLWMRSPAAPPPADPRPLDLNRATVAELARLPGVGPGLAQRIFDERERRGRFDSPEALRHVVGVGPKKLAALRDLVTVGE
jgi:competence ComEA-like helix-hairpin-helix protein